MMRVYAAIISVFRTIGYDEDAVYSIVELFTDWTVADDWMHQRMKSEESRFGGPSNCRISGRTEAYHLDDIEAWQEGVREDLLYDATEGGGHA